MFVIDGYKNSRVWGGRTVSDEGSAASRHPEQSVKGSVLALETECQDLQLERRGVCQIEDREVMSAEMTVNIGWKDYRKGGQIERSSTIQISGRDKQRPPIHDGDDSCIGSDRNKKALAVPVDCVRTVVADDPDLFPKQRVRHTLREADRRVKASGHHRPVGRQKEQLLAVSTPAGIHPAITRNSLRGVLVREWSDHHFVTARRVRLVGDPPAVRREGPIEFTVFRAQKDLG